jgi:hypothetical protein
MRRFEKIIILSGVDKERLEYERLVANKDGKAGHGIEPIGGMLIVRYKDLGQVGRDLKEERIHLTKELNQLKVCYGKTVSFTYGTSRKGSVYQGA